MTAAAMHGTAGEAYRLAEAAKRTAEDAHYLATANQSWADAHEQLCQTRQGQLRSDITDLKDIVKHATLWLLGGMVAVIVTLLGTVIALIAHSGHV